MPPQRVLVLCRYWAPTPGADLRLDKHIFSALQKRQFRAGSTGGLRWLLGKERIDAAIAQAERGLTSVQRQARQRAQAGRGLLRRTSRYLLRRRRVSRQRP